MERARAGWPLSGEMRRQELRLLRRWRGKTPSTARGVGVWEIVGTTVI